MQGADVQDWQSDIEARLAILAEVYSTLTPEPPAPIAATRQDLIEKLTRVRDAFKRLQEQYDPDRKGYETKLFMFYDDLLEIAKGFEPVEYLQDRAGINIPQRYKVEDFFELNLTEYSDIIDLWDDLWDILDRVSSTDRQGLVRSLEDIREKVNAVPEGQHLTCERVALCTLVDIWLRLLGRDKEASPPTIECETTLLPAKHECILRLTVKSDDVLEYDLKVIPPSEEIKVLECQPESVKIGPTGAAEVKCKIKSEVDGKQDLVLVLSSRELEEPHEQELGVEFYDPNFVRPSNPYLAFDRANPFPFPSRNSLRQEVVETIQNFLKEKDGEFLVVELRGIPYSGRSVLAGGVCRILKSHFEEEIATFERCTGDCEKCKHELQMFLESANMTVLIVHCGLAERISNRQETYSELFEVAKAAGATKAIFLCVLPEEPGRDCVVGPLTEADIKSLIARVGLVGGGPGDTEIRDHLKQGSFFLHFDAGGATGYWSLGVTIRDWLSRPATRSRIVAVTRNVSM